MSEQSRSIPQPPIGRLAAALVASCGAALGLVLMTSIAGAPDLKASLLGAGCVLVSGLAALLVLWSVVKNPDVNLGTASLAFSGVRLFGSLALGLVVLMAVNPERNPFVYTFLFAAMAALVLETFILRRWAAL